MFYGQLQYIVVIPIPKSNELQTKKPKSLCLVVIWSIDTDFPNAHGMLPIPFYLQTGALDLIDIKCIQCVVGRVEDQGRWGLVNRSGLLAHAVFTDMD